MLSEFNISFIASNYQIFHHFLMLKLSSEMTIKVAFSPTVHTHRVNSIPQAMFTHTRKTKPLVQRLYGFKLNVPESNLPAEISEIQLNVQVNEVCLVSFRCLLTVSYSVQSTWCTAPTSSPIPSLLSTALCCTLQ